MSLSHDPFFRKILSGKQEAIDFLRDSLPNNISRLLILEKLELIQESFIGNNQEESRTDLLLKIPLKDSDSSVYIYLLFEHKSYYERKIYVQLLEYLAKIYNRQLENESSLSVVLPFVFYHGEKGWDLGENFLDNFPVESIPIEFHRFIPNFAIQLFELKRKGKAFQTRNLALRLYMRMIQIIRDIPEEFKIHLKEIYISLREEKEFAKRIEILRNLLEYLNRVRIDAENYSVKEIVQGIEVEYMNVLDKIRQEGELKGKLENKLETARKMKEFGDTLEKIKIITGLSEDELKENGIF
jgi:predicted transposase/invertase (TIGR01784 family)